MARKTKQTSVGPSTPVRIDIAGGRASRSIYCNMSASATVWVGDSTVTAGTGYPLFPQVPFGEDAYSPDDPLWAISDSGTVTVATMATGV